MITSIIFMYSVFIIRTSVAYTSATQEYRICCGTLIAPTSEVDNDFQRKLVMFELNRDIEVTSRRAFTYNESLLEIFPSGEILYSTGGFAPTKGKTTHLVLSGALQKIVREIEESGRTSTGDSLNLKADVPLVVNVKRIPLMQKCSEHLKEQGIIGATDCRVVGVEFGGLSPLSSKPWLLLDTKQL